MKTGKLKTEIKKVSTLEEGLDEILKQVPQPTGIILFGADSDLKDKTFARCKHNFPQIITGYGGKNGNMALRGAIRPFSEGKNVLTVMDGDSSGDPKQRRQIVIALRDLGAKTVVGIYSHHQTLKPLPARGYMKGNMATLAKQTAVLECNPPATDEVDYLLEVTSE